MESLFDKEKKALPFDSYEEYMEYLFACVNEGMNRCATITFRCAKEATK